MLSRKFPGLGGRDPNAASAQGAGGMNGGGAMGGMLMMRDGAAGGGGGGVVRASSASASTYTYETPRVTVGDPLERELRDSRQKVDALQGKVVVLESMALDLERRLEEQALQCLAAERECADVDRQWRAKCAEISKEVEDWKTKHKREEGKAEALRQHLSRTERELYGILQKKHQILRGSGGGPGPTSHLAAPPPPSALQQQQQQQGWIGGGGGVGGYLGLGGGGEDGRTGPRSMGLGGSTPLPLSGTFEDGDLFQPQNISTRETRNKFMVKSLNEFLGVS